MTQAFADRNTFSTELLQNGRQALREGRRSEARRGFQAAVAANPLDPRAWLELARLSSPVARAFYLVEAFDLNPTNAHILEELRRAYRFVVRLAAPATRPPVDRAPAAPLAPAAPAAPIEPPAPVVPSPRRSASVLAFVGVLSEAARALRLRSASAQSALAALLSGGRRMKDAVQRIRIGSGPAAPAPHPLRLYTLPGMGLWIVVLFMGGGLIATLSGARGWQRPSPVAVALDPLQKVTFTPTPTASPTPTATLTHVPTATPIPSATPTAHPVSTRWSSVLAFNGWNYEPGACADLFEGPVGAESFMWPTDRHYLSGKNFNFRYHPGLDISTDLGMSIYAADTGVVVFAGWSWQGYGNMIVLDHGNGWQTLYAHLSQISVDCGQAVYQGEVIGLAGSTGNSTGPHLHFEILNDTYGRVNPWSYLP